MSKIWNLSISSADSTLSASQGWIRPSSWRSFPARPSHDSPPNDNFQNAPQACASALQAITTPASTSRAAFRHKGPTRCLYLNSKEPGPARWPGAPPPKKGHSMLKDNIAYLLKIAPKKAYIDDLINGRLYMNAASWRRRRATWSSPDAWAATSTTRWARPSPPPSSSSATSWAWSRRRHKELSTPRLTARYARVSSPVRH